MQMPGEYRNKIAPDCTMDSNPVICFKAADYVYQKPTGKCTCYRYDIAKLPYRRKIVGVAGDVLIAGVSASDAQIALKEHPELIPEQDKVMLEAVAGRENDALVFYHLK